MRSSFTRQFTLLFVAIILVAGFAVGQVAGQDSGSEELTLIPAKNPTRLVDAPGREQLEANCLACHTAQPILTHDGFTPQVWNSEVQKMRESYGAKISDEDAAWIIAYLTDNYSSEPVSADNLLLNGLNTTRYQEPTFAAPNAAATPAP